MSSPARLVPEPGLVISHAYLWRREHEDGEESGRKLRPVLLVLTATQAAGAPIRVVVAPITSRQPSRARGSIEVPQRVKAHLGLDAPRCWIICDEYNAFDWPGVDLAPTPTGAPAYGLVPDALLEAARAEMRAARARGALKGVARTR